MAKKITERGGGMKCSPSKSTKEKLSKAGKTAYQGSTLAEINKLAAQYQKESGEKTVTIPAKKVTKYNLSRSEAVMRAAKVIRGRKSFK